MSKAHLSFRFSVLSSLLLLGAGALWPQVAGVVALQHARIIDGNGRTLEDATLVMAGNRISGINIAIPKGATVVDLSGKTIVPGLINAHGHLGVTLGTKSAPENYTAPNIAGQLHQYARYGVTSILSLGLNRDLIYGLREQQKSGDTTLTGATIFTAGRGVGAPGGAPPLNVATDQVYRPGTAEEARAAVREMAAHHPDIVKIWVDDVNGTMPKMKPEVYSATIDEAHRNHLRVAAHIFYLADAKALVDLGVDVIAHSVRDREVDAAFIGALKSKGVTYIPTLELDDSFFLYADHPEWLNDPFLSRALHADVRAMLSSAEWREKVEKDPATKRNRDAFRMASNNLRALSNAGVKIAMGTDSGATPLRVQGYAEHLELELMVEAGMKPMDALVSATRQGAVVCGVTDRGVLGSGKVADLIVLDGNPLEDIRNTRKISSVWHNGRRVEGAQP